MKPQEGTYPHYFEYYIKLIQDKNVLEALDANWILLKQILENLSKEKENYAYAPNKWTVKQLVSHLIDTERIFSYRALRFARKDPQQPLPFEEDHYAANAELSNRNLPDLIHEFETVRKASISLFKSFSENTLMNTGKTAIGDTTVLALGFMICGHARHHLNILQERYLKK